MPGEPLWPTLAPYAQLWRPATAPGELWDTGLGFPCIRFSTTGAAVPGVVVDLDPDRAAEAFVVLDRVEGEGRLYRRVVVVTSVGRAHAYEWLGVTDGMRRLPGGWR